MAKATSIDRDKFISAFVKQMEDKEWSRSRLSLKNWQHLIGDAKSENAQATLSNSYRTPVLSFSGGHEPLAC